MKRQSNAFQSDAEFLATKLDADEIYELGTQIIQEAKSDGEYLRAFAFFKAAAEMGHAGAQNDLGQMLRNGYGCEVDIAAAIHWYEAASAQGEVTACYNLGTVYLHGLDNRLDYALAASYLQEAAGHGHVEACCDLGTMYRLGQGVGQDFIKAARLHLMAAESADYVAIGNLRDYYEELVQPALNGSLNAANALHRIYRNGYAAEFDAGITWAWIRWAHDMCLPAESGGPPDTACTQVRQDYLESLRTVSPVDRSRGDKQIAVWMAQRAGRGT